MKTLTLLLLALTSVLSAAAPALAEEGAMALVDADHAQVVAGHENGDDQWQSLDAPSFQPSTLYTFPTPVLDRNAVSRMRAETGRALLGAGFDLIDVTAAGATSALPQGQMLYDFDAAFGSAGDAWAIVAFGASSGVSGLELLHGTASGWAQVASTGQECAGALSLVLDSAETPVGFCDDQPVTAAGSSLVFGATVIGNVVHVAATRDPAGNPVLFGAQPVSGGWQVVRATLVGGAWSQTTMGVVPVGDAWTGFEDGLVAANDQAVIAVGGSVAGNGREVLALEPDDAGGSWHVETVATDVEQGYAVASGPTVLVGSESLTLYRRTSPGVWTATRLENIGFFQPIDCACRVVSARPGATPLAGSALVLLLPIAALLRERRRRS